MNGTMKLSFGCFSEAIQNWQKCIKGLDTLKALGFQISNFSCLLHFLNFVCDACGIKNGSSWYFPTTMLWGIRPRSYVVEKGTFKCPKCGKIRPYQRTQSKYYFYILYIPVYPSDKFTLMDIVTCGTCQAHYDQANLLSRFNKRVAH